MSEKTTDNKLPYTCTSAYDRNACKGCVCSTCYEQEFCEGAAAAKISRSARSAAMLMRVHTIISPLFFAPHAQKV
ncbi:MAG: hypothetical protein ACLU6Y_15630 [Ruminococcus sp.]